MWKEIYKDKNKHIVKDEKGNVREVVYDEKYKEAEANGDFIQPIGRDKERWLDMHPEYRENTKDSLLIED